MVPMKIPSTPNRAIAHWPAAVSGARSMSPEMSASSIITLTPATICQMSRSMERRAPGALVISALVVMCSVVGLSRAM